MSYFLKMPTWSVLQDPGKKFVTKLGPRRTGCGMLDFQTMLASTGRAGRRGVAGSERVRRGRSRTHGSSSRSCRRSRRCC